MKVSQLFTPLLSTKLHIPRRQQLSQQTTLVSRPRLLARLEAGLAGKLTLIAAPAGFGKTTLLCEWIDGTESAPPESAEVDGMRQLYPPTYCWLSLEENDNDPIRFWLYFIAAIHSHHPGLSADLPVLLQSPEPPPLETVLIILINDLIAWSGESAPEMTPEIIFILEDYHFIATSAIHQSLAFLIDHLPPVLHLVMTTRADPPLPLARLRARGQLLEIRADDLRFTTEETTIFLNQRMGLDLSPNEAQLLAERTEGWISGIQLAAFSMRGLDDKGDFLHAFSGSHRYILTYLIEEVLNKEPQSVQEFLLCTCILRRLSGPLCDAMIGVGTDGDVTMANLSPNVNSQDILEQLEQANLFLVPLDDLGQWYRYHQLFAEVLQYRLRHDQPEILPVLHQRASLWFAEHGYLADAIRHALLATDFAYAAALIEQVWTALWDQGAVATLFGWMQALPEEALSGEALWGQPGLYVSYAWSLALTGQIEAAETTLHQVDLSLQRTGAEAAESPIYETLLGRATSLRAMLAARRGNPSVAVSLAQQAITLIPPEAPSRGDAFYTLGLAWQQDGALTDALQAYDTALQLGEAADNHFLAVAARYHEARVLMAQGHLQRAAATYQQILAIAAQTRKKLPVVGLAHIGYGEILYQWNDLPAADREVELGLALNPRRDLTYTDGPLHRFSILARIRQAMGDREGALAAVELAKETAKQTGIALDIERSAALEVFIQLRIGEGALANQWADRYTRTRTEAERLSYLREFETLVYVRVLLAQDRGADALTLLAQWLPIVEAAQCRGNALELYLLQVLAFRSTGQLSLASRRLVRCLTLAESEDHVRQFVDEGEPMQRAIGDVVSRLSKHPTTETDVNVVTFANRLLDTFAGTEAPGDEIDAAGPPPTPLALRANLIDPLTERELEVLYLVTAGLSNAAIAEQLIISVGTVKTHLKHIYRKLAVQSRTQAVAQARMLGLLRNDQPPS